MQLFPIAANVRPLAGSPERALAGCLARLLLVGGSLVSCQSYAREPGPAWRGTIRGTDHVLTGAEVTGRRSAEPRVEILIPKEWRTLDRPELELRFLGSGTTEFDPRGQADSSGVVVLRDGVDSSTSALYAARGSGSEVYLVRQTPGPDGWDFTIFGTDGWPVRMTEIGTVTWPAASEVELAVLAGYQPNPWRDAMEYAYPWLLLGAVAYGYGPGLERTQALNGGN